MITFVQDGWVVVALPETLDRHNSPELSNLIQKQIETGKTRFVADAAKLNYIDSFGISVLLRESKRIQASGGELKIRNLKGQPLDLVWLTGTDTFLVLEAAQPVPGQKPLEVRPSSGEFRITRENETNAVAVVLYGTICFPTASTSLHQEFESLLSPGQKVVLDFAQLLYLDSATMSEILSFNHKLKQVGGSLRICNPNSIVKDILDAQNLNVIIPVHASRFKALENWP